MAINFARRYNEFYKQQRQQAKEYRKAGMSEEGIFAMFLFDLQQLNRDLAYERHTQPLDNFEGDFDTEEQNPLLVKFFDALTVNMDEDEFESDWWLDNLENVPLSLAVKKLSEDQRALLSLVFKDLNKRVKLQESKG